MDFTFEYCPERNRLEHNNWNLVSKLAVLTDRLIRLIGKDHAEFITTKADCVGMKREVTESCALLAAHRAEHGC